MSQLKDNPLKRMNIRVRPEMHEWLTKNAELRGITLNAMVIFALETYIQQQIITPMLGDMMKELQKMEQMEQKESSTSPQTSSEQKNT